MDEKERKDQIDIVNRFWVELVELKTMIYYHILLRRRDNVCDIWTKIIPAVVSSGGVIGWIVQHEYGFYWALVVLSSHLITAIKHLFPFEIRRDQTFELVFELSKIYLVLEKEWERIMEGELTKEDISKIHFDVKKKIIDIEHKLLPTIIIPQNKNLINQAESDAKKYFTIRYQ